MSGNRTRVYMELLSRIHVHCVGGHKSLMMSIEKYNLVVHHGIFKLTHMVMEIVDTKSFIPKVPTPPQTLRCGGWILFNGKGQFDINFAVPLSIAFEQWIVSKLDLIYKGQSNDQVSLVLADLLK